MKKRDFLFAGLLLMSAPMLAQEIVPDGPTRTKDDARQIFMQDFEKDWDKWIDDTIDVITTIEYYNHPGDSAATNNIASYVTEETLKRDSVIYMKNGVMTTDDKTDIAGKAFANDQYTILTDQDNERNSKLEKFGTDGGEKYFYYSADHKLANTGNAYKSGVVDNYRRNLFVRGIDIEPETSYRLTLYLKVNQPLKTEVVPTFFADVMQGYFHSEKPFLSTVEDTKDWMGNPSKTFNAFEYKQTEFTGDWEKVTFMTYYNGDSLQSLIYHAQYWWNGDDWKWNVYDETGKKTQYFYIKQPQKYFVRLSFASDSTNFCVDNVSLTKSWIGGVEYYNNKIRVDFGYETNLKDLANAKVATTNIDAIELPGEYFQVLGYYAEDGDWYEIPINSAEYHGDGYMYMWTKDDEFGDPITFDYYDTVLVSFINPVDSAELALKYTNSKIYPKSTDAEWVAAGKMVPNFYNELATPNPNVFDGVYSMKFLPPVVQKLGFEDGSFQLPATTKELSFSFSREVVWEEGATEQTEHSALLKLVGNGKTEYWFPKNHYNNDSTIVFVRPDKYSYDLSGDYTVELSQICGYGTDDAKVVKYNYSFGDVPAASDPVNINFSECGTETAFAKSCSVEGFSVSKAVTKVTEFPGAYGKALMFGLYSVDTGASNNAKLIYTFQPAESGTMMIEFGWTGCNKGSYNDDCRLLVTVLDANDNELGSYDNGAGSGFKPDEGAVVNEVAAGSLGATVTKGETYRLVFCLPNEGAYGGSHKGGLVLYYINMYYGMCLGSPYIKAFDDATAKLAATLKAAEANADNYTGIVYDASASVQKQYADFKSLKETAPSVWNKVTAEINDANTKLKNRMGVVDALWAAWDAADLKASETLTADEKFAGNANYNALINLLKEVDAFIPCNATDDSIKAIQKSVEDASAALDTRKALMDDFNSELARALTEINDKNAVVDIAEYAELQKIYAEFKDVNIYTTSDEDLTAARDAVKDATNAYVSQVAAMQVRTVRLKELAKEAKTVGVEFDEAVATEYAARVENANDEDLGLENVYKQAIKVAILKKIVAEQSVENIDLTGFIRNFNLYVTAKVIERTDKQVPGGNSEAAEGYNMQHSKHAYNSGDLGGKAPIWVMITGVPYTDLYPGWTVKSTQTGNAMVTPDDASYGHFKAGQSIFDGQLAMDWNSKAELSTVVEDLPAGLYKVGFDLKENTNDATKLTVTADGVSKSISCAKGASGKQAVDSVMVTDGSLDIYLNLQSGSGWSIADDFTLNFINKVGYDYAADLAAEEQKLSEMITFVDAFGADAAVEYIGLDGVKMNAPKAGQVSIKVTRKADGARVIEKVLVK